MAKQKITKAMLRSAMLRLQWRFGSFKVIAKNEDGTHTEKHVWPGKKFQ